MKVFVVMGNDFPDCVFDDSDKADEYIKTKKDDDQKEFRRIYWRSYEFEVKS